MATTEQTEPVIRCPHCNEEIDRLGYASTATHYYDAFINGGEFEYEEQDIDFNSYEEQEYTCPACGYTIAIGQDEAEAFLTTGNIPSEGDEALAEQAQEVQQP